MYQVWFNYTFNNKLTINLIMSWNNLKAVLVISSEHTLGGGGGVMVVEFMTPTRSFNNNKKKSFVKKSRRWRRPNICKSNICTKLFLYSHISQRTGLLFFLNSLTEQNITFITFVASYIIITIFRRQWMCWKAHNNKLIKHNRMLTVWFGLNCCAVCVFRFVRSRNRVAEWLRVV